MGKSLGIIKIAVIDNGVRPSFLRAKLKHQIQLNDKEGSYKSKKDEKVLFLHGTLCALIIEKFMPDCAISSVQILDENGQGGINKLRQAFEWCLEEKIDIVNLSLGTTNFRDKEVLQQIVNDYARKGLIIIAAFSNEYVTTYPASFSNVIGVAVKSNKKSADEFMNHLGIDAVVYSKYHVFLGEQKLIMPNSNSFATPYVSVLVAKILQKNRSYTITEIKKALKKYEKISVSNQSCLEPDWIHTAYLLDFSKRSAADFYFRVVEKEKIKEADTLIVNSKARIGEALKHDKQIVYVGKELVSMSDNIKFFWTWENKLNQIRQSSICKDEIEIPVIICECSINLDELFFLSQVKNNFYQEGYNIYTASFKTECVLHNIEFIPEEILEERQGLLYLYSFIYWQIHNRQNDIFFLLGDKLQITKFQKCVREDMLIKIVRDKLDYNIIVKGEEITERRYLFDRIDEATVCRLSQDIRELLEGKCE